LELLLLKIVVKKKWHKERKEREKDGVLKSALLSNI
jgi:hypothetical protein